MKLLVTYKMKNGSTEAFLSELSGMGIPEIVRAESGCLRLLPPRRWKYGLRDSCGGMGKRRITGAPPGTAPHEAPCRYKAALRQRNCGGVHC